MSFCSAPAPLRLVRFLLLLPAGLHLLFVLLGLLAGEEDDIYIGVALVDVAMAAATPALLYLDGLHLLLLAGMLLPMLLELLAPRRCRRRGPHRRRRQT